MKLFKNFLMCLCTCALALGFASCGGDDDDDNPGGGNTGGGSSTVTQEIYKTLDNSEATTEEFTFNASENWKVENDATWCKVALAQGTAGNSKKLTVNVEDNFSKDVRVAHITVKGIASGKNIATITLTQPGYSETESDDINPSAPEGVKKNASGVVKSINVGWNLGNTGEATDEWTDKNGVAHSNDQYVEGGANLFTETSWQKAKTTKAMFTALKNAGFNAVRIPIRWYRHADKDLNINKEWMARVKEIVDYAVSQDMYVILNSHHDNWYDRLQTGYNETEIHNKFKNMWTQIANNFKDYDEHLIFAATNEIISVSASGENWGNPNDSHYKFINNLMQLFVTTVRATGGNNEWRCLMVQPWACNPAFAINSKFVLPTDTKKNRLIVEYHCYDPYDYATAKDNMGTESKGKHEVSQAEYNSIATLFANINAKFVVKGIPCIMAEFGSTQDNTYSKGAAAADKIRADYHTFIVKEAKKYNIPGFYWDNYSFEAVGTKDNTAENFGLFDRASCTFPARAKIALDGIMNGLK